MKLYDFSQTRRTCGTTHFIRPCTILHATGFGLPPNFEDWMMCHKVYLFIIIYSFSSRFGNKIDDVSWESVHSGFKQNGLSNVLGLMDLLHSLPPTSILNETSFNQMKLIKTDRRHRLSQKHLNDLMMIRLQSPSIMDFDPTTAINKWMVSYTVYYNMILIFGV